VRYFRITGSEGWLGSEWEGKPTYWFEINEQGDAERQIVHYPNGNTLSYDTSYCEDEYEGLQVMVVDGDEEFWIPYTITKEVFELEWNTHMAMNRDAEQKKRLVTNSIRTPSISYDEPPF